MVELIVNNKSLDVYESEVISIVIAINDLASIEKREGNYSNKFKVPSTARNNNIFGYPNELNFVTGFKPTKSRGARIVVNGLDVQVGFIQVEQFNQKDKVFSVSFFSGNTDWLDDISDKILRDIDLDKYNHIWNSTSVADSMGNTEGYIYPFIDYGRYRSVNGFNTDLANWMPAMYTHTLLKEMFNNIGWKMSESVLNDPIFRKHIIPFSLKDVFFDDNYLSLLGFGAIDADLPNAPGVGTPIAGTVIFSTVTSGNTGGVYNELTGEYTCTSNSNFNIYSRISAVQFPSGGLITLSVGINGITVATFGSIVILKIGLEIGDVVGIYINEAAVLIPSSTRYNKFSVAAISEIVENGVMPMSGTLPDMSQEDFLRTVFNQFGIIFTSDNISKTVFLNSFEDIKNNIKNAIDWTDKLDYSRDLEIDYTDLVSDYSKKNKYGYEENKDFSLLTPVAPFLGNGSFVIDNDFLSSEDDLFTSEFVASQNVPSFNNRTLLMYIRRYSSEFVPESSPDLDPLPRCSICVNNVTISDLFQGGLASINIVGISSTATVAAVPFTYFDLPLTGLTQIDSINQSLSFGSNIKPKAHETLLDTYYEDYINILNNPRKVTAYFLLNERDVNNLDLLIPIYLGGELNNYFYINKVSDYRPSDSGVTKVELVLIV